MVERKGRPSSSGLYGPDAEVKRERDKTFPESRVYLLYTFRDTPEVVPPPVVLPAD